MCPAAPTSHSRRALRFLPALPDNEHDVVDMLCVSVVLFAGRIALLWPVLLLDSSG